MISASKSLECRLFIKSLYLAPKLGFLPTSVEQYDKHNMSGRGNWFWKYHQKTPLLSQFFNQLLTQKGCCPDRSETASAGPRNELKQACMARQ
jgi:hypothetical protein